MCPVDRPSVIARPSLILYQISSFPHISPSKRDIIASIYNIVRSKLLPHIYLDVNELLQCYTQWDEDHLDLFYNTLYYIDHDYNVKGNHDQYLYLCSYLFHQVDPVIYNDNVLYKVQPYYINIPPFDNDLKCYTINIDYESYYACDFSCGKYDEYTDRFDMHPGSVAECILMMLEYMQVTSDKEDITLMLGYNKESRNHVITEFILCLKHSSWLSGIYKVKALYKWLLKILIIEYIGNKLMNLTNKRKRDEEGQVRLWKYIKGKIMDIYKNDINTFNLH